MRIVVLTRNPSGIASRFLARRAVEVERVLLDEGAVVSRAEQLRGRLRKLRRVGPTAIPVGLTLRRAYAAAGEGPPLDTVGVPVVRVPTLTPVPSAHTCSSRSVASHFPTWPHTVTGEAS